MKKGSHHNIKARKKVSIGLKNYFKNHSPWNKGLRNPKYSEPAYKRFRRDKNYYLLELESNAKRAKKLGYHDSPERRKEIGKLTELKQQQTGAGRPRKDWGDEEIKYLKENYFTEDGLGIALKLGRSWSSIMHKVNRLGLQKYNKWN